MTDAMTPPGEAAGMVTDELAAEWRKICEASLTHGVGRVYDFTVPQLMAFLRDMLDERERTLGLLQSAAVAMEHTSGNLRAKPVSLPLEADDLDTGAGKIRTLLRQAGRDA